MNIEPNGPQSSVREVASLQNLLSCAAGAVLTIPNDQRKLEWVRAVVSTVNSGNSLKRTQLLEERAAPQKPRGKGRAKAA